MKQPLLLTALAALATACTAPAPATIDWLVADLPNIEQVSGSPTTIDTPLGPAVRFDGEDDAFFLATNPLADMESFTVEAIVRQHAEARFEQRFLHIGSLGPRILLETRVNRDSTWYLDTYVHMSEEEDLVLIDSTLCHRCDRWYNLTMVVAEGRATSYVDGVEQCTGTIPFRPIQEGITSVGVRQNRVCWFDGDLYRIRITPCALTPDELLTDQHALNR